MNKADVFLHDYIKKQITVSPHDNNNSSFYKCVSFDILLYINRSGSVCIGIGCHLLTDRNKIGFVY
jgi:hypothetical protein